MALLEDRTAVFIVRIWCETGESPGAATEWRGSVEHVQTGARTFFRHLEDLLDVLRPHLEGIGIDARQRFWERIASVMDEDASQDGEDAAGAGPARRAEIPIAGDTARHVPLTAGKSR